MKGPSLLQYVKSEDGANDRLEEVARIYQTLWTTAVEMWDMDTVISSDAEGNMSIWRRDVNGVTEEDRRRLQLVGDMRIGELINRIRKGRKQFSSLSTIHINRPLIAFHWQWMNKYYQVVLFSRRPTLRRYYPQAPELSCVF